MSARSGPGGGRGIGRRAFVAGSFLAAVASATGAWRRRGGGWPGDGDPLPDGRVLVRGAALAFGTTVSIAAVHADPAAARAAISAALGEVRRVDALMTLFRDDSEVSRLNATGELLRPDRHLVRVLELSQRVASLSDGAFDPTVQPLWALFAACRRRGTLPSRDELAAARARVGWAALEVSARRVALGRRGMAITLNGVAQGYATDLAWRALREGGVRDALIDAGEHGASGARQPGSPWAVGVRHPRDPEALVGVVAMDGRFLAASGDYAAAFSDDYLHHHIFDPRTGLSPPRLASVVVAAATGIEADALTKPMMVLEQGRAEALLARFPGAGAAFIGKDGRLAACHRLRLEPSAAGAGAPS